MRHAWVKGFAAVLVLGACSGDGCCSLPSPSCDVGKISLDGPDECTPAGGTCTSSCGQDQHADPRYRCPGFVFPGSCCVAGASCEANGGACVSGSCGESNPPIPGFCAGGICCKALPPLDAGFDVVASFGTCDGLTCFAGCACAPPPPDAGARGGTCECGEDAGAGDAGDGGVAVDADDGGDGGDAGTDAGQVEACGVLTCRGGCICVDATRSACLCP